VVTSTADSGAGTLRDAINYANAQGTATTIDFNIPGPGVHTIGPLSGLPTLFKPTILDGTSQPGYTTTPSSRSTGPAPGRRTAWTLPRATPA
jgi:hypothetical protein